MEQYYRYVNCLANKQRRKFEIIFPEVLSGAQAKILHYILYNENRDVYQKDIEEEFGLRPPSATALLKAMEQHGLLRKEAVKDDGRYKRIVATEKAQQYKQQLFDTMNSYVNQLLKGIDDKDLEVWKKVCMQMLYNLE